MSMVEVDPKLFIKCRLCLEDTGTARYQIVPSVREQINYCFDINIEPFDGLPQLICKKCQHIICDYTKIKKFFIEKQDELKKHTEVNGLPQVSEDITPAAVKHENSEPVTKYVNKRRRISDSSTSLNELDHNGETNNELVITNTTITEERNDWTKEYQKTFACRLCHSSWSFWKSAKKHRKIHSALKFKHADVFNKYCLVELPKIDGKPNITDSMQQVVYSKKKIIGRYNSDFCISYTYTGTQTQQKSNSISENESMYAKSLNSDESSDSSSAMKNQKVGRRRIRRRICSRSSNETVVLEDKSNGNPQENNCISIDDTDSDDEKKKTVKTKAKNKNSANAKVIAVTKLIATTHNKYIKKNELPDKPSVQQLTRKITSIGRQIINRRGFNTTRLMKYMEHLNLNVIWLPRSPDNVTSNSNYFKIIPRWKYPDEKKGNQFEGYNKKYSRPLKLSKPEATIVQETVTAQGTNVVATGKERSSQSVKPNLVFSGANCSTTVSTSVITGLTVTPAFNTSVISGMNVKPAYIASVMSGSNVTPPAVSDSITPDLNDTLLFADTRKLLNKNPVANPKQLPKQFTSADDKTDKAKFTVSMPTLEVNAAEPLEVTSDCENTMQMPIITFTTSLFVPEPQLIETSISENPKLKAPRIKVKSVTELMSKETLSRMKESAAPVPQNQRTPQNGVAFRDFGGHLIQNTKENTKENTTVPTVSNVRSIDNPPSGNDYVTLDTVELPNTRTSSPFKYFRMLLQLHNLNLLDSDITLSAEFNTLIKFKVLYNQESKDEPVILCLSLFCSGNNFCLKIKDRNEDNINMIKISANWQWEVMKIYRGDVVAKVLHNAEKISQEIYENTNRFLCLLKSINYIKK